MSVPEVLPVLGLASALVPELVLEQVPELASVPVQVPELAPMVRLPPQ